eukprot:CAMPEP_0114643508 /NCGR_PEP_ID=MMETSP0191-20121206/3431_1 /TAXON_ID=126664 /ORGANISM="Sorites sp." /LENGTH=31 /DNA_ID= /DNA_START= /DNA_END= /DNA_ORIENTATION=
MDGGMANISRDFKISACCGDRPMNSTWPVSK